MCQRHAWDAAEGRGGRGGREREGQCLPAQQPSLLHECRPQRCPPTARSRVASLGDALSAIGRYFASTSPKLSRTYWRSCVLLHHRAFLGRGRRRRGEAGVVVSQAQHHSESRCHNFHNASVGRARMSNIYDFGENHSPAGGWRLAWGTHRRVLRTEEGGGGGGHCERFRVDGPGEGGERTVRATAQCLRQG